MTPQVTNPASPRMIPTTIEMIDAVFRIADPFRRADASRLGRPDRARNVRAEPRGRLP